MCFRVTEDTIFRAVEDRIVALNLDTGQYYTMNEVGARMWLLLEQGESTANIISKIKSEFQAPAEQIAADLTVFIADLLSCNLIEEI